MSKGNILWPCTWFSQLSFIWKCIYFILIVSGIIHWLCNLRWQFCGTFVLSPSTLHISFHCFFHVSAFLELSYLSTCNTCISLFCVFFQDFLFYFGSQCIICIIYSSNLLICFSAIILLYSIPSVLTQKIICSKCAKSINVLQLKEKLNWTTEFCSGWKCWEFLLYSF